MKDNKDTTDNGAAPLRSIRNIIADLSKPIAKRHLQTKTQGGAKLTFISWYHAVRYLDHHAPGWSYDVSFEAYMPAPPKPDNARKAPSGRVFYKATIAIPCLEGTVSRSATGMEDDVVAGYGDQSSNAESMALRRAAAKFGLGLYLYDKED